MREEEKDLIGLHHFFLSSICFCKPLSDWSCQYLTASRMMDGGQKSKKRNEKARIRPGWPKHLLQGTGLRRVSMAISRWVPLAANATILYYRTPPHLKCSRREPLVPRSGRLSVVAPPIPPKPASTDRWGSVQQLCIEILFKQCSNIVKIFLELRWLMKIVLHSYGRALGLWLADWHWGRRWIRMIRSDENDGW